MGVEPNAWSRALPVLCADLLRHWERDARFLCCQKIHIQFSTAEPGGSVYLPRGAFRNQVDGASGRPRSTAGIKSLRGGGGEPPPYRELSLKERAATWGRPYGPHLPRFARHLPKERLAGGQRPPLQRRKNSLGRAGEDTRPYPDAGTVPFSSQGPVPDRPAGAHCAPLQRKTAPGRWFGKLRRRSGTAIAVIFRLLRPPVGPDGMAPKHTWSCAPEGLCPL